MFISVKKELLKRHVLHEVAHTRHPARLVVISLLYLKTDSRRQLDNSLSNTVLFCAFYKKSSASELFKFCPSPKVLLFA